MQNTSKYGETLYPLTIDYLNILKEQLLNLPDNPRDQEVRVLKMRIRLLENKLRKRKFYLNK